MCGYDDPSGPGSLFSWPVCISAEHSSISCLGARPSGWPHSGTAVKGGAGCLPFPTRTLMNLPCSDPSFPCAPRLGLMPRAHGLPDALSPRTQPFLSRGWLTRGLASSETLRDLQTRSPLHRRADSPLVSTLIPDPLFRTTWSFCFPALSGAWDAKLTLSAGFSVHRQGGSLFPSSAHPTPALSSSITGCPPLGQWGQGPCSTLQLEPEAGFPWHHILRSMEGRRLPTSSVVCLPSHSVPHPRVVAVPHPCPHPFRARAEAGAMAGMLFTRRPGQGEARLPAPW